MLFLEQETAGHSHTIISRLNFLTEENKVAEVLDESDKELIRVARQDIEDDEPKEKSHKEKKRSTEGNKIKRIYLSFTKNVQFENH